MHTTNIEEDIMGRYLTLVRHGQSTYNASNRFTGWLDPELTDQCVTEAHAVAEQLRSAGLTFDIAFSSAVHLARRSARIILDDLKLAAMPVTMDFALDERNYGEMSGLDKDEARSRWGADQVQHWRRSYADAPPDGESLRDTIARVLPFYIQHILPAVMRGQGALVLAHGNSLRALVMALDGLSTQAVTQLEIATGEVLVYELAADTTITSKRSLAMEKLALAHPAAAIGDVPKPPSAS